MKKIFITIPWFYPAYKAGGPIQSIVNMINELKEEYEFYIFTSNTDLNKEIIKTEDLDKWIEYNDYTKIWYDSGTNRSNEQLKQVELIKPDIVYIIGLYDWHFNIVPLLFCKAPKKIVSVRGMLHPGALTEKVWKKKIFLGAWRLSGLHRKVIFHATDNKEEGYIKDCFGSRVKIEVAGNFPRKFGRGRLGYHKQYGILKLLTVALISPMKNHLLVLNALRQTNYKVKYDIYGPVKDQEYWQECEKVISELPWNIKVKYHGDVEPVFVQDVLVNSEVFIMPSKSENFGHSIIEALSAGLPVITSNHTPWNGLDEANAGRNVEQTEDAVARAIEEYLKMDKAQFERCIESAQAYAEKRTDLDLLNMQYEKMFTI